MSKTRNAQTGRQYSLLLLMSGIVLPAGGLFMTNAWHSQDKTEQNQTAEKAEIRYALIDLGTLGGSSYGQAINNQGQIAVIAEKPGLFAGILCLWEKGHLQEIGTLPEKTSAFAGGINEKGEIVGSADRGSYPPFDYSQALIYRNGKIEQLFSDNRYSKAIDINDRGDVVGFMAVKWRTHHAFLWNNGTVTDLGTLGGSSSATSINAAGHIVGESVVNHGNSHAFLWKDGKMQDLGTLGGDQSYAGTINDNDQIVGSSAFKVRRGDELLSHAFLWENGTMHDLGSPGRGLCGAGDINNRGQIVGNWWPENTGNDGWRALLWENGKMYDLNDLIAPDSGWVLESAGGINEQGEIVGWGKYQGWNRAFLLVPK